MATRIKAADGRELEIESNFYEYGIERDGEVTYVTDEPVEAQFMAKHKGNKLLIREVFETAWADAPNQ